MRFTRARDLVSAGVIAGVVVYLGFRLLYGSIASLPTLAGVTLLVLAIVEAVFGSSLRSRIKAMAAGRPVDKPLQPLTAARALALAKASSILGAIMLGAWLGVAAYLLPRRDEIDAAAQDLPSAIIGMICAGALIAAALWLEYCCRTPRDQDERPPGDLDGSAG